MQEDVDEGEDEEEVSTVNDNAYIMQDGIEAHLVVRQCTLDCVYKCTLLSYPVVLYCVAINKQSTFGLITCHTLSLVTIT